MIGRRPREQRVAPFQPEGRRGSTDGTAESRGPRCPQELTSAHGSQDSRQHFRSPCASALTRAVLNTWQLDTQGHASYVPAQRGRQNPSQGGHWTGLSRATSSSSDPGTPAPPSHPEAALPPPRSPPDRSPRLRDVRSAEQGAGPPGLSQDPSREPDEQDGLPCGQGPPVPRASERSRRWRPLSSPQERLLVPGHTG